MYIAQQSAKLNPAEYRQALNLLDQEREAAKLTQGQRWAYVFLNIAVYGCFLSALVALAFFGLEALGAGDPKTMARGGVYTLAISVIFGMLSPFAVLFNLSLIRKIWQRLRFVRRLEKSSPVVAAFERASARPQWRKALSMLPSLVGVIFIMASIGLFGLMAEGQTPGDAFDLLAAFGFLAIGLSLILSYFIRRGRRQLRIVAELGRLRNSLEGFAPDEDTDVGEVTIPTDLASKLESIERQQIYRGRGDAILATQSQMEAEEPLYYVQKSRVARDALNRMPIDAQLQMDDALVQLTVDPRPDSAVETDPGEFLWKPEGSAIGLKYSIDEEAQNIRILDLDNDWSESADMDQGKNLNAER